MKLRITTLIIIEEGQVQDIYHSFEDDQDKAYQEIIDQVNAEQEDINLRTLRIKELEISFTVTRRTKSEYLKSLDFWYNPLTNYKEYQIPLQK